jgi:hypothetical protein
MYLDEREVSKDSAQLSNGILRWSAVVVSVASVQVNTSDIRAQDPYKRLTTGSPLQSLWRSPTLIPKMRGTLLS